MLVCLIFLFLVPFACYFYMSVGGITRKYYTITNSFFSIFQIFVGSGDLDLKIYMPYLNAFVFLVMVFIINLILFNMLISTLEMNYLIVRGKVILMNEIFEIKYILCFCCFKRENPVKKLYMEKFDESKNINNFHKSHSTMRLYLPRASQLEHIGDPQIVYCI